MKRSTTECSASDSTLTDPDKNQTTSLSATSKAFDAKGTRSARIRA